MVRSNRALKDEIAEYWSARAASFDGSPGHGIADGDERLGWAALLRGRLGPLRDAAVLELASGTGEFTALLVEAGARVTGLDLSEAMLARARRKLAGTGVRLFMGDAEDTREAAGHYRAVVCRHLVWTLPEPQRALADWFRVLQPGGRLLVIDGDWVRVPWLGRMRRALGRVLMRVVGLAPDPVDWAAHERIMERVHFRAGLRPGALTAMLAAAGFTGIETGSLAAIRRAQRRAVGFPRSLVVGGYREFWLSATKPAA